MLKIRVTTLPEKGLDIDELLPCESINKRLAEAPDSKDNKIEFLDAIHAKLHLERVPHGMSAEGEISATCSQLCSRCADSVPNKIICKIKHLFKHHSNPETPLPEDDIGINYFSGEHVEMASIIEDLLILKLSPYWHPEDNSKGDCTYCGKNQQEK